MEGIGKSHQPYSTCNTLELRRAPCNPSSTVEKLRALDPEGQVVPLRALARESGLSVRQFERAFKERFRTSRRPFLEDRKCRSS